MVEVLRSGQPDLEPAIADHHLRAFAPDAHLLTEIRATQPVSSMVVPLIARGRAVGAILLVSSDPSRRYGTCPLAT